MSRDLARLVEGDTREVARRLLGCQLVVQTGEERLVGRIVETEAYLSAGDPASHSACGPTQRNRSMFLAPGHAYVYLSYGVHQCFNVVTGPEGSGEAVLVRALEPLAGLEHMRRRRQGRPDRELCSGPGKLTQAMGIQASHDGACLIGSELQLEPGPRPVEALLAGPRIGIQKGVELPYRFCLAGNPFLSRT